MFDGDKMRPVSSDKEQFKLVMEKFSAYEKQVDMMIGFS